MTVGIAVLGAAGRMGRTLVRTIAETKVARLDGAVEGPGNPALGKDAGDLAGVGPLGVRLEPSVDAVAKADVWIDFSAPAATVAAVRAAAAKGVAMVIGTTGIGANERQVIADASGRIPIVFAPNMAVGVNVLLKIVADAAQALGPGYDIEVVEAHHRAKRDAPSGTALRIAEVLAEATARNLASVARYDRHGDIGPRTDDEIGIQTVRGGDVIGDHTVHFLGQGERIEITHRASSRDTFARGAVRAALWVAGKKPGLYDMGDVLGLR